MSVVIPARPCTYTSQSDPVENLKISNLMVYLVPMSLLERSAIEKCGFKALIQLQCTPERTVLDLVTRIENKWRISDGVETKSVVNGEVRLYPVPLHDVFADGWGRSSGNATICSIYEMLGKPVNFTLAYTWHDKKTLLSFAIQNTLNSSKPEAPKNSSLVGVKTETNIHSISPPLSSIPPQVSSLGSSSAFLLEPRRKSTTSSVSDNSSNYSWVHNDVENPVMINSAPKDGMPASSKRLEFRKNLQLQREKSAENFRALAAGKLSIAEKREKVVTTAVKAPKEKKVRSNSSSTEKKKKSKIKEQVSVSDLLQEALPLGTNDQQQFAQFLAHSFEESCKEQSNPNTAPSIFSAIFASPKPKGCLPFANGLTAGVSLSGYGETSGFNRMWWTPQNDNVSNLKTGEVVTSFRELFAANSLPAQSPLMNGTLKRKAEVVAEQSFTPLKKVSCNNASTPNYDSCDTSFLFESPAFSLRKTDNYYGASPYSSSSPCKFKQMQ